MTQFVGVSVVEVIALRACAVCTHVLHGQLARLAPLLQRFVGLVHLQAAGLAVRPAACRQQGREGAMLWSRLSMPGLTALHCLGSSRCVTLICSNMV